MMPADRPLRAIFLGSPSFALPVLESLLSSGVLVVAVYTQPDRPAGRGLRATSPPVKEYALGKGLNVFQPPSLRPPAEVKAFQELDPDVAVVAAYGRILPPAILGTPGHGCLNVHPSLLPRHRGPSPVVTAILEGDRVTGVTLMQLDEGMDTGPILAQQATDIQDHERAGALTQRLFCLGGQLLAQVLLPWCHGQIEAVPQDSAMATVTRKVERWHGEIKWATSADQLVRMLRAYDPWPGIFTYWKGQRLKVVEAQAVREAPAGSPGLVVPLAPAGEGVAVITGRGMLELKSLQLEGKRSMSALEFVRGQRDFLGSILPQ